MRPLSCAQTLDLLWHPLGCSSCCVVSPFWFLSRPFETFFVALRSQTIGFFGSTHSWSPWLPHSFSCSATIPMQMQLQTKVLLHTCSGSPPVHMDIRTQMRLAGREKHMLCWQVKQLATKVKRSQRGSSSPYKGTRCQLPIKAEFYHILMPTFVPGYDYMGSCDAILGQNSGQVGGWVV